MAARIEGFTITRYSYPADRVIGDSQVRFDYHYQGTLELHAEGGLTGIGFFGQPTPALPSRRELTRIFEAELGPGLIGETVASRLHRQTRPRGGNQRAASFRMGQAVDQALWDLHAQELGLPLWRLLGGRDPRVEAYASGLDFNLSHDDAAAFFQAAAQQGFSRFKIKVGHPEIDWDLERLRTIWRDLRGNSVLMIDANEAWTAKETIHRLHVFKQEGFDVVWMEDPCLRDDFEALARVTREVPFAHVVTGEYLDLRGKRKLIEAGGADILNTHGVISHSLKAAWLAGEYGIPVTFGNTPMELGVHMAAALPEVRWMEYSFQNHNGLLEEPVRFENGVAIAPDRPGLGLRMSEEAKRFAHDEIADDPPVDSLERPAAPLNWR